MILFLKKVSFAYITEMINLRYNMIGISHHPKFQVPFQKMNNLELDPENEEKMR